MPITFASICPHPPILIPEIGGKEREKIKKTVNALNNLSNILANKKPETLIVISPHGLVYPDRMNICGMPLIFGDFGHFGHPEVRFKFTNDLRLAEAIDKQANQEGIKTLLYNNGQEVYILDHGSLVPLYFLTHKLDRPVKLIPVAYSLQDRRTHFKFGQIIQTVVSSQSSTVGIIASGDLSHRLLPSSPNGYGAEGKKFDQKLVDLINKKATDEILYLDEDLVEEAGECGYQSILILLGALSGVKWEPEILSYEGPFGVGYLVCNFKIKIKSKK